MPTFFVAFVLIKDYSAPVSTIPYICYPFTTSSTISLLSSVPLLKLFTSGLYAIGVVVDWF